VNPGSFQKGPSQGIWETKSTRSWNKMWN